MNFLEKKSSFPKKPIVPAASKIRRSRAGAALLLVLGFVVLLSFLTVGILQSARREMLWQAEENAKPQLEIAAHSALEVVLATIANFQSIDGAIYSPLQGWANALTLAGFEYVENDDCWKFDNKISVDVKFRDESGRFALNSISQSDFTTLFTALGISTSEIDALYDCFSDWIDSDDNARTNGAEIDDYEDENSVAIPPNRSLREFAEIRYIKKFSDIFFDDAGTPNSLYYALENAVSLVSETTLPNINTANSETLKLLVYETDADPETISEYLSKKNSSGTTNIFRSSSDLSRASADSLSNKVSYGIQTLRIIITARRGAAKLTLDTLLSVSSTTSSSTSSPFKILEQTENLLPE